MAPQKKKKEETASHSLSSNKERSASRDIIRLADFLQSMYNPAQLGVMEYTYRQDKAIPSRSADEVRMRLEAIELIRERRQKEAERSAHKKLSK